MNAQVATPITETSPRTDLQRALKAAQRQEAAAVDALGAADRDLANKRKLVESCQRDADQASAAISANEDMLAAEHLANQARAADVRLSTSRNMLAKAKTTREMAQGELQAAHRAVDEIAQQLLLVDVRAKHLDYLQALETFNSLRNEMLGAYHGPGRAALSPRQWLALNLPCFTFAELGVGSPEFDVPVNELQNAAFGLGPEDQLRAEKQRIDGCSASWRNRLEATVRGDSSLNTDAEAT